MSEMKEVFVEGVKELAEKVWEGEINRREFNKRSGELLLETKPT
jgi:hypothetical protein